jgi:hypothetical protein
MVCVNATRFLASLLLAGSVVGSLAAAPPAASKLERMKFNHLGLVVDLGAGLWSWPLPMDVNGDGHMDMVIDEEDVPYNGVYVYEHPGTPGKMPVFKPGRRLSDGMINAQVSYVDGKPRVLTPGKEHPQFAQFGLSKPVAVPLTPNVHPNKVRGNMWRYADFDGDGRVDLVIGVDDWTDYGEPWTGFNAYDAAGRWLRGPQRGQVYVARNEGSTAAPRYAQPFRLQDAQGQIVETYGWPSPCLADWDGDGDLDLLCGEFLNRFTYFQNVGTRTAPQYLPGVRVKLADGSPLEMEMQMITPVAVDWDRDGDPDLICGEENGRAAFIENTGRTKDGVPLLLKPVYFQQQADELKCGALATPCGVDWDGDGDWDLICGNSAGWIMFLENLSGPGVEHPQWARPVYLEADGRRIRIQAGPNGSIQGPGEACFGYTVQTVGDWDGDGLLDIVANSIWGKVVWFKNVGTRKRPKLAAAQPIEVEWNGSQPALAWGWVRPQGKALLTQWRTSPVTVDWNKDGLADLVMLDQEGYLALFPRAKTADGLKLLAPERLFFYANGKPLQLNARTAGASGRRKICVVDLDGDGALDFLVNSTNASWLRQTGHRDGKWYFEDRGPIDSRRLSGHSTCPTAVDFDNNGLPDVVIGAEDGHFYYRRNPRAEP